MTELAQLSLLIGVNAANVATVEALDPRILNRDVLVLEEGHLRDRTWDQGYAVEMTERLSATYPRCRIMWVARPSQLPIEVPDRVSAVLIDHEADSYPGEWETGWAWQLGAVERLRALQPKAGLISPPPTIHRLALGWNWAELGHEMAWHNVMTQAAGRGVGPWQPLATVPDPNDEEARWNDRAALLWEQHGANTTAALSMQLTMKPDAPQYTEPARIVACCRAARSNGVPNVLLFGASPGDLTAVMEELRVAYA